MPAAHRLTVADLRAFRPARRIHGAYFSLAVAPAPAVKAAFVVSKKIAPRAVTRNLVKRRSRASLSPLIARLAPAHYVFYAKKEAVAASFSEIKNDIGKLADRYIA